MTSPTPSQPMTTHTPTPWATLESFPEVIAPLSHVSRSFGGSIDEADDRDRYALVIAKAESNQFTGFAHEITRDQQRANAALIVAAVNSHASLKARIEALETALRKIDDDLSSGDRPTVNQQNAFQHFVTLNKLMVGIRQLARAALASKGGAK